MADVRTFRAVTMHEALDRVRLELGNDAVILSTRQVPIRRLLPWGPREEFEITAGIGITTNAAARRSAPALRRPAWESPAPLALNTAERRAAEIVKELSRRQPDGPFAPAPSASPAPVAPPPVVAAPVAVAAPVINMVDPPTSQGRFDLQSGPLRDFSQRLDAIERMLTDLGRRQRGGAEFPPELLGHYEKLLSANVEETVARELMGMIQTELPAAQWNDSVAVQTRLRRDVESRLKCVGPISTSQGTRRVVALVGPTGVGKTTTLAKLAAGFRLRDGLRTGLVTVDTYRIAAVDQLRTYAEIIDLPMKVVTTPDEMQIALEELAGLDVVLIDTAGRSPRDEAQLADLRRLLDAARPDEVHLVLSLAGDSAGLMRIAEQFRPVGPTAAIVTKLDEADGPGGVLSLCSASGLPLSYVTTGQDVPDDIEAANLSRLSRSIVQGRV